ncbi:MAG: hypothetical protein HY253_13210 [Burkholderiales bacterium]|nr:hypothetical protein [Burkholderiales bacterium]
MKHQITHISPIHIAKIFAILYFAISLPFLIFMEVSMLFSPLHEAPRRFLIAMPIVYGLCGFVVTFVGAILYNFIASKIGGIEFTTREVEEK